MLSCVCRTLVIWFVFSLGGVAIAGQTAHVPVAQIKEAISDEILALGYDRALPTLPWSTRLYIGPIANRTTRLIYDFPPFGEVVRTAYIQRSGIVLLADTALLPRYSSTITADSAFAPTHNWAIKARFLQSEEIKRMKAESRTAIVTINSPSEAELREARSRQRQRVHLAEGLEE